VTLGTSFHYSARFDFAPPKTMTTGSVDPAMGLANLAVPEELRRAAGRLLVALGPAWDLLLRAKHLSVAAIDGWGSPGLRPTSNTMFVADLGAFRRRWDKFHNCSL
jgi:hypothetical protein